ncbi:MAG TPA: ABC transporter permease, partial [Limnochordales bacterium]
GLGVQPPAPEWGTMLSQARGFVHLAPHMMFFPGLAIALLVLGLNATGDVLRDRLDPTLRKGKYV